MNFSDLLDEDGQGTRRCDAWLAENIANHNVAKDHIPSSGGIKPRYSIGDPPQTPLPNYTTGDSIDPILNIAKDYFNYDFAIGWDDKDTAYFESYGKNLDGIIKSNDVKLSIAEALFKAYQKEKE